jgi:hypothetical protein
MLPEGASRFAESAKQRMDETLNLPPAVATNSHRAEVELKADSRSFPLIPRASLLLKILGIELLRSPRTDGNQEESCTKEDRQKGPGKEGHQASLTGQPGGAPSVNRSGAIPTGNGPEKGNSQPSPLAVGRGAPPVKACRALSAGHVPLGRRMPDRSPDGRGRLRESAYARRSAV